MIINHQTLQSSLGPLSHHGEDGHDLVCGKNCAIKHDRLNHPERCEDVLGRDSREIRRPEVEILELGSPELDPGEERLDLSWSDTNLCSLQPRDGSSKHLRSHLGGVSGRATEDKVGEPQIPQILDLAEQVSDLFRSEFGIPESTVSTVDSLELHQGPSHDLWREVGDVRARASQLPQLAVLGGCEPGDDFSKLS